MVISNHRMFDSNRFRHDCISAPRNTHKPMGYRSKQIRNTFLNTKHDRFSGNECPPIVFVSREILLFNGKYNHAVKIRKSFRRFVVEFDIVVVVFYAIKPGDPLYAISFCTHFSMFTADNVYTSLVKQT